MNENLSLILLSSFIHAFNFALLSSLTGPIAQRLSFAPVLLRAGTALGILAAAFLYPIYRHRYSCEKILQSSFFLCAVVYLLQALCFWLQCWRWVFLALSVIGGFLSAFSPDVTAFIIELKDKTKTTKMMSEREVSQAMARALGPGIGLLFFTLLPLPMVYVVAATLAGVCYVVLAKKLTNKSRFVFAIAYPPRMHYSFHALFIHAVSFVFYFGHATFEAFFATHLKARFDIEIHMACATLMMCVVCSTFVSINLCPHAIHNWGVNALLLAGTAITSVAFFCMGQTEYWEICHLALVVCAGGAACVSAAISNILLRITPGNLCVNVFALDNVLYASARVLAPTLMNFKYHEDFRGAMECFRTAGFCMIINIVVLFATRKNRDVVTNLYY